MQGLKKVSVLLRSMGYMMFRIQWPRRIIQIASLYFIGTFSYYGIFRCPFAVPYVSCENCPVIQCPGKKIWLSAWIAILASGLMFGRAFCSYACPGGMVSELFSKFSVLKGVIRNKLDKNLSYIKYISLVVAIYLFWFGHNPRWAIPIRTGDFWQATSLTFEHAFPLWFVRTGFVLVALLLGLVIPYFWCRFFCPTGGLLEIFSHFSLFRYKMKDSCTDCGKCEKLCGMGTRPSRHNCTNCGSCAKDCPVDFIELENRLSNSNK